MLLKGLKILELGNNVSVAYCCKLLSDFGAEVVKIEKPPAGDELRYKEPFIGNSPGKEKSILFHYLNINKFGVTVDIEKVLGSKIINDLLKDFDVVIESYQEEFLKQKGLDYDSLKKCYPRLIMTSILPYGDEKEFKSIKSYDINVSALSGISAILGEQDRKPLNFPYCNLVAGASAAGATLTAVLGRESTGEGEYIDISEIEVIADLAYDISIASAWGLGKPFNRGGYRGSQYAYPWTMLPVKDGYVTITFLGPRTQQWWESFLDILGNPSWAKEPRYQDLVDMGQKYPKEVDALLKPLMEKYTREEFFSLCKEKNLPVVPVLTPKEAMESKHVKEQRKLHQKVCRSDIGELIFPGLPVNLGIPYEKKRPAPMLGEHNNIIFSKYLGLLSEEIIDLKKGGII